jgi:hypothetical protein
LAIATGVGAASALSDLGTAIGNAAGIGAAAAVGMKVLGGVGNAAGFGLASANVISTRAGVGNAAGVGTATASRALIIAAVANATGIGSAQIVSAPTSIRQDHGQRSSPNMAVGGGFGSNQPHRTGAGPWKRVA